MSTSVDLSKWLRGYDPERRNGQSVGALEVCHSFEVGPTGLHGVNNAIVSPTFSHTPDWPFPMLFQGEVNWIAAQRNSISSLNSTMSVATSYTLYDPSDYVDESLDSVASGAIGGDSGESGIWHFADFGNAWFLTNGSEMAFKHPEVSEGIFVDGLVYANTCCAYRGRLWLGGLAEMFGSTFVGAVDSYRSYNSSDSLSPGDNWVWYSSVGIDDVFWLFFPWMLSKDEYIDVLERAESGFLPMRWKGKVQVVKGLGDWIIVYGMDGITAIQVKEGMPIRRELANFGIGGRGAVCGTDDLHMFVGSDRKVYSLSASLKLDEVGYDGVLSDEAHVTAYDPIDGVMYISGADKSYSLTKWGLSRTYKRVSSVAIIGGDQLYSYDYCDTDLAVMVKTGWVIGESRRPRTVVGVEIDCDDPAGYDVYVSARQNVADTAWHSSEVDFDSGGYAPLEVCGVDFQVTVKDGTPCEFRGLWLHFADHSKVRIGDLS